MFYVLWLIFGVVFLLVLFFLGMLNHWSKEDPLSGLYFASRIYYLIITLPNLETVWMKNNSMDTLSAGADKVLQCVTQYPTRILEQCLLTHYRPYLNAEGKPYNVIFFNTNFSPEDMSVTSQSLARYQALALDKVTVLAEANSYNELAKYIGLSNVAVRNNMNWTEVVQFNINDTPTQGYLHQLGATWRDTLGQGQLSPKRSGLL
ncbi:hypothetical protein HMPREF2909_08665 [Alloscardovia sp. HMSC034E08]|nr:hypothetical protein HMPREF2909_08665 [Alloscardovia sp. HMSC034E08]